MSDHEKGVWDTEYLCKKSIYNRLREIANDYANISVDKQSVVNRCSDAIMTMSAEDVSPVFYGH